MKAGQDLTTPDGFPLLMPQPAMAEVSTDGDQPFRKSPWKPNPVFRESKIVSQCSSFGNYRHKGRFEEVDISREEVRKMGQQARTGRIAIGKDESAAVLLNICDRVEHLKENVHKVDGILWGTFAVVNARHVRHVGVVRLVEILAIPA